MIQHLILLPTLWWLNNIPHVWVCVLILGMISFYFLASMNNVVKIECKNTSLNTDQYYLNDHHAIFHESVAFCPIP